MKTIELDMTITPEQAHKEWDALPEVTGWERSKKAAFFKRYRIIADAEAEGRAVSKFARVTYAQPEGAEHQEPAPKPVNGSKQEKEPETTAKFDPTKVPGCRTITPEIRSAVQVFIAQRSDDLGFNRIEVSDYLKFKEVEHVTSQVSACLEECEDQGMIVTKRAGAGRRPAVYGRTKPRITSAAVVLAPAAAASLLPVAAAAVNAGIEAYKRQPDSTPPAIQELTEIEADLQRKLDAIRVSIELLKSRLA